MLLLWFLAAILAIATAGLLAADMPVWYGVACGIGVLIILVRITGSLVERRIRDRFAADFDDAAAILDGAAVIIHSIDHTRPPDGQRVTTRSEDEEDPDLIVDRWLRVEASIALPSDDPDERWSATAFQLVPPDTPAGGSFEDILLLNDLPIADAVHTEVLDEHGALRWSSPLADGSDVDADEEGLDDPESPANGLHGPARLRWIFGIPRGLHGPVRLRYLSQDLAAIDLPD